MNNKLESAQDKFMEGIGKLAESVGVNPFIAQLYAVLYLSDKPLSLDELVERLKASKGNISLNIRELEKWGAVKNIWVKGSRKDYYEANMDVKKLVVDKLKSGIHKRIDQMSNMLDEFSQILDSAEGGMSDEERKIAKGYREKLKKVESMKAMASKALSLAEKLI